MQPPQLQPHGSRVVQAVRLDPDLGHLVEDLPVHAADHDRGDPRVAGLGFGAGAGQPAGLPGAGGDPLVFYVGGGVHAAQVGEVDEDLGQGGLPGAVGQQPGLDQPVQRLGQGVMLPLLDAAVVFRAEVLAEGVEDGLQSSGAPGGQVPVELPHPAERRAQPQVPVVEPVLIPVVAVAVVGVGVLGLPRLGDGPREDRQVLQRQAAGGGVQQDGVGLVPFLGGQLVGPVRRSPSPRTRRCPRRPSSRRSCGAGRSRFCQPTAPLAAPLEIPVLLISQARAERCPSGSYPDCAVNAARLRR